MVKEQINREIEAKIKRKKELFKKFERESSDRLNFLTEEFKKEQEAEEVKEEVIEEHKP